MVPIDKAFIISKCLDLSETTIERTLNRLLKEDKIVKISGGRYTKYKKKKKKITKIIKLSLVTYFF